MSVEKVYEDSELKIRVKLKPNTRQASDKAKLVISLDGQAQSPIDLSITKDWVEHKHTFAKVADDKSHYVLSWVVTQGTETHQSPKDYSVWPKKGVIKLVADDDGRALPDTLFTLDYADGNKTRHKTGNDGTCECLLKHKATFDVSSVPATPFNGYTNGKSAGRNREVKLTVLSYRCKIATPQATAAIKQYVNFTSANNGATLGHDAKGPTITINLEAVPSDGVNDISAVVKTTDVYHIKATFSDLTKRTASLAAMRNVTSVTDTSKKKTATIAVGNDGKASFELQLGIGGGEKCTIEVGRTDKVEDAKLEFIVWRKLVVHQVRHANQQTQNLSDCVKWFAETFIEVELAGDQVLNNGDYPAGTLIPRAELGVKGGGDAVVIGTHNIKAVRAQVVRADPNVGAYAMLTDLQFDGTRNGNEFSKTANGTVAAKKTIAWPADGSKVPGVVVKPVAGVDSAALVTNRVTNGAPAVTATWKSNATTGTHAGKTGIVPATDIHVEYASSKRRNKVYIRLTGAAKTVYDADVDVEITLTAYYALGPYLGWSPDRGYPKGAPGVVLALHNGSSTMDLKENNKTMVHEIGHMIGMLGTEPAGLTLAGDHKRYYTGRGHSGGHCANGVIEPLYKSKTDFDDLLVTPTCTMYGAAHAFVGGAFCARCKPFVLALPVDNL